MKSGKSILILFIFLLLTFPFLWFTSIFPVTSANYFFRNISNWVNTSLIDKYPPDLIISVNKGQVTLNRSTPYCLVLREKDQIGIVFDLLSEPDIKSFESGGPYHQLCQPIAVVSRNYVMFLDKDQIRITKISSQTSFEINKTTITDLINKYLPILTTFGKNTYLVLPFISILPVFLFFLLNNYWYYFVTKLVLKIFKIYHTNFSAKIYGTTLFCFTIITFIRWIIIGSVFSQLLKFNFFVNFPFLNTILITIICLFYFSQQKKSEDNSIPVPPIEFQTITPPKHN